MKKFSLSHRKRAIHILLIILFLVIINFIYRTILSSLKTFNEIYIIFCIFIVIILIIPSSVFMHPIAKILETSIKNNCLELVKIVQLILYYGSLLFITGFIIFIPILLDSTNERIYFESNELEYNKPSFLFFLPLFILLLFLYGFSLTIPDVYGTETIINKFHKKPLHLLFIIFILLVLGFMVFESMVIAFELGIATDTISNIIFIFFTLLSMVLLSVGSYLIVVGISIVLLKLEPLIEEEINQSPEEELELNNNCE